MLRSFPGGSDGKEPACNAGDPDWISGSGRSPREGNGYPLPYSWLENPMNRGALWAIVHRVTKSLTWQWLSTHNIFKMYFYLFILFLKMSWKITRYPKLGSFPGSADGKESTCNTGDPGSIPGSGSSPGEGIATESNILGIPWWLRQ